MRTRPLSVFAALLLCTSSIDSQEVPGSKEAGELIEHAKNVGESKSLLCLTPEEKYPLSQEECRRLHDVERILETLLPAAGFSRGDAPGQVRFLLDLKRGGDAFYYESAAHPSKIPEARYIVIGRGWLARRAFNDSVVAETLSHEIAHGVQYRDLASIERKSYMSRQLESHADLIGAQIALRAGYTMDPIRQARALYGCIGNDDAEHATKPDRWVNVLLESDALPLMVDNDVHAPFKMVASPAVFDKEGRLVTKVQFEVPGETKDNQLIVLVANSWTKAIATIGDRVPSDSRLRDLAVQACGASAATNLSSALADVLAHPRHLIRIRVSQ